MTLARIAAAVVDGAVSPGDEDVCVSGAAFVDSRRLVPCGLFAAVVGERVDGHDYATAAVAAGAAAVLASRPVDVPSVVVPDVVAALGALARHVVRQLPDLTTVGLTGSQGKTSTKDMLAAILGGAGRTVAPEESFNNEIGVPLTALQADAETRYLVAEMGARGNGHIAYLADIVAPQVGLVLNVGVAHLGEFGSRDAIAAAKGELVEALPADGLAVLNADDARVLAMAERTSARVLTFGVADTAGVQVGAVGLDDDGRTALRLSWQGRSAGLALRYVGAHHAANAAAAAAVALGLGLGFDDVVDALRRAEPRSKWRMQITTSPQGVLVVNDTYNANPDSMRAALTALVDVAARRGATRTFAVLGDMRELGDSSRREHEALGRFAAGLGVTRLVAVGEAARSVYDAAVLEPEWTGAATWVGDAGEAVALLFDELRAGDAVLVKASRATGLEHLAAALETGRQPAAGGGQG